MNRGPEHANGPTCLQNRAVHGAGAERTVHQPPEGGDAHYVTGPRNCRGHHRDN